MDIIIAPSGGQNIVIWPMAVNPPLPDAKAAPVLVVLYMKLQSEPVSSFREAARGAPGADLTFLHTPDVDEYVNLCTRTFSATGAPDYATVEEAFYYNGQTVLFSRVSSAPTVAQVGAATQTRLTLAVDGYEERFARLRQIRVADNPDMTGATAVVRDAGGGTLPRLESLSRSETNTSAQTVYVRVSHSSGGAYSAESPALAVTFASSAGTGGTSGDGDEIYTGKILLT